MASLGGFSLLIYFELRMCSYNSEKVVVHSRHGGTHFLSRWSISCSGLRHSAVPYGTWCAARVELWLPNSLPLFAIGLPQVEHGTPLVSWFPISVLQKECGIANLCASYCVGVSSV
ncbi:hypothetical protein KP509_05G019200 [Ceratopteris richardii]|nr:hypothetical protein KP509_05G019200 [Ceratopteris richardii]